MDHTEAIPRISLFYSLFRYDFDCIPASIEVRNVKSAPFAPKGLTISIPKAQIFPFVGLLRTCITPCKSLQCGQPVGVPAHSLSGLNF